MTSTNSTERYQYDTPVVHNRATNPLTAYLHIPNPSHLGKHPFEFPDGAVIQAATFRKFISIWRKAERVGKVDSIGGAQCCNVLWSLAHDEVSIDEIAEW